MAALPKDYQAARLSYFCGIRQLGLITKKGMEAGAMKEKVRGMVHGLMCIFNRHEYIVRLTFGHARCDLKTCRHCGKSEVAG
jgi:hypothetical protein